MKQFLTLLVVSLLISFPAFAQELEDPASTPVVPGVLFPVEQSSQSVKEDKSQLPPKLFSRGKSYSMSIAPMVIGQYCLPLNGDADANKLDVLGSFGYGVGVALNTRFGRRTASSKGGTGLFSLETGFIYSVIPIDLLFANTEKVKFNEYRIPLLMQFHLSKSVFELGAEFSGVLSTSPKSIIVAPFRFDFSQMTGYMTNIVLGYKYEVNKFDIGYRMVFPVNNMADNFKVAPFLFQLALSYKIPIIK